MGVAFVFAGQGSQAPGMGHEILEAFPVARHVIEQVDAAPANTTFNRSPAGGGLFLLARPPNG